MTHAQTRSGLHRATTALCTLALLLAACSPSVDVTSSPNAQPPSPANAQPDSPALAQPGAEDAEAPIDTGSIDPESLDASEPLDERTLRAVRELYERARDTGEKVPDEVEDWTRETVARVYSWDYKVEEVAAGDPAAVEERLTTLGRERWECFHVHSQGDSLQLYMKRRSSSFLRAIPFRDLLKFVPIPGGGGTSGD